MTARTTGNSRAFTLAEVVVTIAIVGASLMYFMYITLENNDRSREAYKMRFYKTLARDKMEEFLLARMSGDENVAVDYTGEFKTAPGYFWEINDSFETQVPFQDESDTTEETEKTYTRYLVKVDLKIYIIGGASPAYSLTTWFQESRDNEN